MSPRPQRAEREGDGSPGAADFLAVHRGGGLLTEAVNQRLGAHLAAVAWRLGATPTTLTMLSLLVGLGTSVITVVVAGPVDRGTVPGWIVGVGALVVWHVGYSLDCADGQLARVTGRSSPAGARVDVLADVAIHVSLIAALAATASEQSSAPPAWLVAVVAGTWMVNVVTSVLHSGDMAASLIPSTSRRVRILKVARDQSFVITVCAVSIGFVRPATPVVMVFFACLNGGYLVASIVAAARQSVAARSGGGPSG